jgi:hypothetical protein
MLAFCVVASAEASMQPPMLLPQVEMMLPDIPRQVDSTQMEASHDMMDRSRGWVANYLDNLSGGIDSFFVDVFFDETFAQENTKGSLAKISFYTRREIGDPVDYKFGVGIRLVLPHTNERLNLLLESEDEQAREGDPLESVENPTYSAALRFIIRETEYWTTNIDAGVKWAMIPDPFVRLRARRFAYFDHWNMRITQTFSYFTSDGYGEDTALVFDYPLSTERLLRLETKASYLLNDDFFELRYGIGSYRELSRKAAIALVGQARGDTENGATFNHYSAAFRYRRQVYKSWMFFEVAPGLEWSGDKDYETTPVIMFRLEAVMAN